MAKWFWSQKLAQKVFNATPDFAAPYTRPVSNTIWDERFNLTTSIVNQPVTKQFLEFIGSKQQLPDHRYYGYVAALALLDIMDGLTGTKPEDLEAFKNFGGPYEEGGPDWTTSDIEEERANMIENILGKAEEFVFKADAFEEAASSGSESKRLPKKTWEARIEVEIKQMGAKINKYKFQTGKKKGQINSTALAGHLHSMVRSDEENKQPESFPTNPKTLARRLPEILARKSIRDK
jgi:hypothetical protein